eukprot:9734108-Alexandrium_andersonii.AAC.1
MYAVLASLTERKALSLVQSTAQKNGYEAWRLLVAKYQPLTSSTRLAALTSILDAKELVGAGLERFEEGLLAWEQNIKHYEEATSVEVQESAKKAILI